MQRISVLLFAAALAAPACSTGDSGDPGTGGTGGTCGDGVCQTGESEASCPTDCTATGDQWDQQLSSRTTDYNAALRIASLRLTGKLPTMADITAVSGAPTDDAKKTAYVALVNQYIAAPEFKTQVLSFWRDTFKQGGSAMLDTAPVFAAKLSVENGSYMDLFTASAGNCPTFDGTTFTAAECANGGPKAGVLTNPGVMTQFYSNFAFRRTRWVQETFVCAAFPAEVSDTPKDIGAAAPYTGVWPFDSIAGTQNGGTGRVDFKDTSATICANCHSTINHIAPLFAMYDMAGAYQTTIAVQTPLDGAPLAKITDYLPPGQQDTAWRFGKPAADIPALGAAMAADPQVAACGVARMWNWALGKTDIVDTLQQVPNTTIQTQIDAFTQSGFKLKDLILAVYTSDDFVKF